MSPQQSHDLLMTAGNVILVVRTMRKSLVNPEFDAFRCKRNIKKKLTKNSAHFFPSHSSTHKMATRMSTSEMLRALRLPSTTLVRTDSQIWVSGSSHVSKNADWIRRHNWNILRGHCMKSSDDPVPLAAGSVESDSKTVRDDDSGVRAPACSISFTASSNSIPSSTLP